MCIYLIVHNRAIRPCHSMTLVCLCVYFVSRVCASCLYARGPEAVEGINDGEMPCSRFFTRFVLLYRLYAFVKAAGLRSIVLRYAGVPIATRVSFFSLFFVCLFGDVAFSEYIFLVPFPLSPCMESTSYVLSFRMVFFLPCDHGLDF